MAFFLESFGCQRRLSFLCNPGELRDSLLLIYIEALDGHVLLMVRVTATAWFHVHKNLAGDYKIAWFYEPSFVLFRSDSSYTLSTTARLKLYAE